MCRVTTISKKYFHLELNLLKINPMKELTEQIRR